MHILLARTLQGAALAFALVSYKCLVFLLKCHRAHRRYRACRAPGPPTVSPILGNIPQVHGPKGAWVMAAWANTYGPLYKMQFFNEFVLVCTDPDTIARITRRTGPGPYMPKPRHFYEPLETAIKPQIQNILTADDGEYWKAVRQGAAPCFSATNLKKVLPMAVQLTKRVADHMAGQSVVDVTDGAKRITSDIMGDMLMGEDLGGTRWERSEYLELFLPVIRAQAELLNNHYFLWQLWRADVRQSIDCMKRHNKLMNAKVARLFKSPPPEHTIAAHLLRVKDPTTGKPLTPHQLKAEISVFMSAGFETTSHAITWSLALLALYPEVQEELVEELVAAGIAPAADGSSAGRDFAASDLGRLPLLAAVMKEALRVCPPAPFGGSRMCPADGTELCGYKVDKGTGIMLCALPFALAKHTFGPDAGEFRPHRWLSTASSSSASTAASSSTASSAAAAADDTQLETDAGSARGTAGPAGAIKAAVAAGGVLSPPEPLTFMMGPRDCIGQNLAKLEIQVVVAMLLSRFRFSPGPDLQKELQVVSATGQPRLNALHALAGVHVTLQPLSGALELSIKPRLHNPARACAAS